MGAVTDFISWFNADRLSVTIAVAALAGIVYSAQSARAAKRQAKIAHKQVEQAEKQVEVGRLQVELLLRQIQHTEEADALNRQAQRESLEPMVVVDIAPGANDPGVFVLTISNVGPSIARNIRIQALDEMVRSDGTRMHDWSVFTDGIATMPPGHRLQFFYDVGFNPFLGKSPVRCSFLVDCEGTFGPVQQAKYEIDLAPYEGAWAAPTTLHSVVKELDKISDGIKEVSKHLKDSRTVERTKTAGPLVETTQMNDEWKTWKATE